MSKGKNSLSNNKGKSVGKSPAAKNYLRKSVGRITTSKEKKSSKKAEKEEEIITNESNYVGKWGKKKESPKKKQTETFKLKPKKEEFGYKSESLSLHKT